MLKIDYHEDYKQIYINRVKKIKSTQNISYDRLSKDEKKFLYYVFACLESHPNCNKINNNKTIEQIKSCQVRCQYSYEYA